MRMDWLLNVGRIQSAIMYIDENDCSHISQMRIALRMEQKLGHKMRWWWWFMLREIDALNKILINDDDDYDNDDNGATEPGESVLTSAITDKNNDTNDKSNELSIDKAYNLHNILHHFAVHQHQQNILSAQNGSKLQIAVNSLYLFNFSS